MIQSFISSFKQKAWNAAAAYGIAWLWVCFVVMLIETLLAYLLGVPDAHIASIRYLSVSMTWLDSFPLTHALMVKSPGLEFLLGVVFAPIFEEAVFRMLPLTLVIDKRPDIVRAVQIGICGILFGTLHGSVFNVLIQGFVGYMLARLYVKNATSQFGAYASCVAVHAAYNLTLMLVPYL